MTSSTSVGSEGINAAELARVAPFFLGVDGDLCLRSWGPAWEGLLEEADLGRPLSERFEVLRPSRNPSGVAAFCVPRVPTGLRLRETGLRLQGMGLARGTGALLLLSPLVEAAEDLAPLGLGLSALSPLDPTPQHLLRARVHSTSLEDARRLAATLQARNAELDELRLAAEQARDQAERLAAARAAFLATMSHEVRTPLHGICGAAELLGRLGLSGRALELQQALERSAAGLKRIIDDVLDLSRLEKGAVLIGAQELDVEEVLQTLLAEYFPLAFQKGLEFRLEIAPDCPGRIVGDPGRIRQVLGVLLSNAIKFTEEGLVRLRLSALREGGLQGLVDDDGPGIPLAFREVVFDTFRQVDHSASRAQDGTGLGLAIGQQLANAMGGSLRVEDGDLRGTRVNFSLPCPVLSTFPPLPEGAPDSWGAVGLAPDVLESARVVFTILGIAEAQPAKLMVCGGKVAEEVTLRWNGGSPIACALPLSPNRIRAQLTPARLSRTKELDGLRVLVAEDNLVNQLIIRELLLSAGAQVEVVADGAAAVSRWEQWPCDVVILDCMMPGMDGYDACIQIRARQGSGARVPIFAMTAATLPEDLERCREAGMDRVLTKPARLDGLIQALRETIPRRVGTLDATPRVSV